MEKKQRMFYFGTHGDCKYSPLLVRGNTLPLPDYCDTWDNLKNHMYDWIMTNGIIAQARFLDREWTVYGRPWSVDDKRRYGAFTSLFWEGEHTIDEFDAFIKQSSFLQCQFCVHLEPNMVSKGDIVCNFDGTLIEIHHIGKKGKVHYIAFADENYGFGEIQRTPYVDYYDYIQNCHHATPKQKRWLMDWIAVNE